MRWGYKTVHYPLKKEGLLGNAFLDEAEIEGSLNEYGKAGWELVNLLETVEGLTAVFKQPLSLEDDFTPAALAVPVPRRSKKAREESPSPGGTGGVEREREIPVSPPPPEVPSPRPEKRGKTIVQPMDINTIRIE